MEVALFSTRRKETGNEIGSFRLSKHTEEEQEIAGDHLCFIGNGRNVQPLAETLSPVNSELREDQQTSHHQFCTQESV